MEKNVSFSIPQHWVSMSFVYGASLPLVTVVEYLESSMSRDLLGKFPDNSAFDFDYTQSSIWSPLMPHPTPTTRGFEMSRKLSFGESGLLENTKRIAGRVKRKLHDVSNIRKKRNRRKSLAAAASPPKVWGNVMKAATMVFKKIKKNKNQMMHDSSTIGLSLRNFNTSYPLDQIITAQHVSF